MAAGTVVPPQLRTAGQRRKGLRRRAASAVPTPSAARPASRPRRREAQSCSLAACAWSSKRAVCPVVRAGRLVAGRPQVSAARRRLRLRCLLRAEAGPGQVAVEQSWREQVREQRAHRRRTDPVLPSPWVRGSVQDRLGGDLRLVDRRHRPRTAGQLDSCQSNCGVFIAGSCTIVTCTFALSCNSPQRTDSWKPWMACLAPQYADCSGMPR